MNQNKSPKTRPVDKAKKKKYINTLSKSSLTHRFPYSLSLSLPLSFILTHSLISILLPPPTSRSKILHEPASPSLPHVPSLNHYKAFQTLIFALLPDPRKSLLIKQRSKGHIGSDREGHFACRQLIQSTCNMYINTIVHIHHTSNLQGNEGNLSVQG